MAEWLNLAEAAEALLMAPDQVEALIDKGWLPEPEEVGGEPGLLPAESLQALGQTMAEIDAGKIGLIDLEELPAHLPPQLAGVLIGVGPAGLRRLVGSGTIEAVNLWDLSDEDLLALLQTLEASAPDRLWDDAAALLLDTMLWKLRHMNMRVTDRDREGVVRVMAGAVALNTQDVRREARRRWKWNPPTA